MRPVLSCRRRLLAQMREREKEMDRLKGRATGSQAEDVASETRTVGGVKVLAKRLQDGLEPKDLRAFVDTLKNRLKTNYIAVVASTSPDQGNAFLIAAVSADLTGRFNAGEIAKEIAGIVGGSGGGRPDMAQAGGKNVSKLPEALARVYEIVEKTRP